MTVKPLFEHMALIGVGLIGSSIAHAARQHKLVGHISCTARTEASRNKALELGIADTAHDRAADAVIGADLIVLCAPVGAYGAIAAEIGPHLSPGAILTDVGSVKQAVIRDVGPQVPEGVHFIPGHPVAGTEQSGPEAGFAELFEGRWCILTPPPGANQEAVDKLSEFWTRLGSKIEIMDPRHHDQVLAITSHIPHLIAYNIVSTVDDLEKVTEAEVIKYSAGGFRDFTRIAASDPVMWRDVFLNNREAVLEMLGRFSEDLAALQRAIRWGEGDKLEETFTRTRRIRREIIDAGQDLSGPDFGRWTPHQEEEAKE
jgi:cyclohexadieny/prephenate dehydrogenase